jgi:predicted nucleic acid-binding protein
MKCLETDFLVATLRGKEEAERIVKELDEEGKGATTAINSFELFFGANRSERKNEKVKQTSKLERLIVFPLDFASSRKAADISAKLAAECETIDFRDAVIAAIAIENGLTLISRNEAHFKRVTGLKLEVW